MRFVFQKICYYAQKILIKFLKKKKMSSKKLSFKEELLSLTNAAPILTDRDDDAYSDDGEFLFIYYTERPRIWYLVLP